MASQTGPGEDILMDQSHSQKYLNLENHEMAQTAGEGKDSGVTRGMDRTSCQARRTERWQLYASAVQGAFCSVVVVQYALHMPSH
jgi:hypothetical protein